MKPRGITIIGLILAGAAIGLFWPTPGRALERPIVFPVIGSVRYSDDFGAYRSGGRTHEGNDLLGYKGQPLVAAVDGTVRLVNYPEPDWGNAVILEDADGYEYWYLHMNNDRPGTDDGRGGGMGAYAPDMVRNYPIVKGQLIGWMGDSGNAEYTTSHLHFEIHSPDGPVASPFLSLQNSEHIGSPVNPPALPNELLPYGQFRGGASIALGEFDGNTNTHELVTGAGPGGGPQVRVFKQTGHLISQFYVYDKSNRNGLDVTTGDVNGDGIDEIITGPMSGGRPEVKVFSKTGQFLYNFLAYSDSIRTGINVTAGDLNNDGQAEIVTGLRSGDQPLVRVFSGTGYQRQQFFAYTRRFRGGVDVALGAATETTPGKIITGAGPGSGPLVRVFDRFGKRKYQFYPYTKTFTGGVRVSFGEYHTNWPGSEIMIVPASVGGPDIRIYSQTGVYRGKKSAFEVWWRGGYDIAVNAGTAFIASGQSPRRASVREIR